MIYHERKQSLTFLTMYISPSRFTHETHSNLYVTRAVFTISGTGRIAVTAVESSIITSYINADTFYNIVKHH